MKKFLVVFVFISCIGLFQMALGQGVVNVKFQGGYSLGTSKQLLEEVETRDSNGLLTSVEDIYHSFGKGINIRGAVGIPVTPNIELNFETGISLSNGTSFEETFGTQTETTEITARHIPILITVIASTGGANGIVPYAGGGGGVYLYSIKSRTTAGQAVWEEEHRVKMPIGFHGLVGFELPTPNNITFFGEIRFVSLSLLQSEIEVTEAKNEDGMDVLNFVDIDDNTDGNQQVLEYEKDNKDKPAPGSFPASNIGIIVGAKISL